MKTGQKGTKRRRGTYKGKGLVEKAGALHVSGCSNRQIAGMLGIKRDTVPNLLAESDILREYREELRKRVPAALKNVDMLLTPGSGQSVEELGRNTRWVLDATQVAVRKTESQVGTKQDAIDEMSLEELESQLQLLYARKSRLESV